MKTRFFQSKSNRPKLLRTLDLGSRCRYFFLLLLLSTFILPTGVLISCGKKGPPVPPREKPLPAIADLKEQIQDSQLTLTWTVPTVKRVFGFYVYRSKTAVSEPECKDCPVLFTRVTDIPITQSVEEEKTFTYTETLEKGYRYIYKVTVYTETGLVSSDSNYVKFVH
jgi:hypothetical protein